MSFVFHLCGPERMHKAVYGVITYTIMEFQGTIVLTWINFNPKTDTEVYRWCLEMDK